MHFWPSEYDYDADDEWSKDEGKVKGICMKDVRNSEETLCLQNVAYTIWPTIWLTFGPLLAYLWLTVGLPVAYSWITFGSLLAYLWLIGGLLVAHCWPTKLTYGVSVAHHTY